MSHTQHCDSILPGRTADKWQQAYRFLGGFIDCDHGWSDGSHDSGDQQGRDNGACSRWMMWASVSPPPTPAVCFLVVVMGAANDLQPKHN